MSFFEHVGSILFFLQNMNERLVHCFKIQGKWKKMSAHSF